MSTDDKKITHITVGDGTFEPSPEEIDALVKVYTASEAVTHVYRGDRGWEPISKEVYEQLLRENQEAGYAKHQVTTSNDEAKMPEGHPGPPPPSKGQVWATQRREHLDDLQDELKGRYALILAPKDSDTRLYESINKSITEVLAAVPDSLDAPGVLVVDDRIDDIAKAMATLKWPHIDSRDYRLHHLKGEPLEMADDFMDRVRARRGPTEEEIAEANKKNRTAFLEFFDLAGKLNETAHAFGIKAATLNADTGEVTVVFRTREAATTTP